MFGIKVSHSCILFFLINLSGLVVAEKDALEITSNIDNWKQFSYSGRGSAWTKDPNGSFSCEYNFGSLMFFTPSLQYNVSSGQKFVDVNAVADSCENVLSCNMQFYIQHVDSNTPKIPSGQGIAPKLIAYADEHFTSIYNFTNGTTTKPTFSIDYRTPIIRLGVKVEYSSWTLYNLRFYHYYCEDTVINNVRLKQANPGTNVTANCSENASPTDGNNVITIRCLENGTWSDATGTCSCFKGHEPRQGLKGCKKCDPDYYKKSQGNVPCRACGTNKVNNDDNTDCRCKPDHYFAVPGGTCYSLPPKIQNLVLQETGSSLIVNWEQLSDNYDGLLYYHINCYLCDVSDCRKRVQCEQETYDPGRTNLTKSNVTISNLKHGKTYVIRVYSRLKIAQKIPEEKWRYKQSSPITLTTDHVTSGRKVFSLTVISAIGVACFILVLTVVVLIIVVAKSRRRAKNRKGVNNNGFHELPEIGREQKLYVDPSNYDDPELALKEFAKEIEARCLHLEKVLGGGEFGDVYQGILTLEDKTTIDVAAKTLKHDSNERSRKDFFLEASAMGQFQDPNVVKLEGIITKSVPHMIITEYMSNGSLDNFLKQNDGQLTLLQMIGMVRGVASGMKYLASINFVHRDLAARNILVNDTLVCKVADFGLSRELETADSSMGEYCTTGGKIPVRWTAPEAIKYRKFSSASDVWSFGILLWEIMTFGDRPYWSWDNFKVMERVEEGFRLPSPKNCPKNVHSLMLRCWETDRGQRPQFSDIVTLLNEWIRSPERITDEASISTLPRGASESGATLIKEWLDEIKMSSYMPHFTAAGYQNLSELAGLEENELKDIGITLIGHRNKMLRSIRSLPITTEEQRLAAWKRAESLKV